MWELGLLCLSTDNGCRFLRYKFSYTDEPQIEWLSPGHCKHWLISSSLFLFIAPFELCAYVFLAINAFLRILFILCTFNLIKKAFCARSRGRFSLRGGGTADLWLHSFYATPIGPMLKSKNQLEAQRPRVPTPAFQRLCFTQINTTMCIFCISNIRQLLNGLLHPLTVI